MPNPAFIVEGQMEQRIVGQLCPGQPIRRIGCNGDDVAIPRMCDFIETQIRTLGNRNYPIIVIFDRENRQELSTDIADAVLAELGHRGLADQDIRIFVADRETEDWYLRDIEGICAHYGLHPPLGTPTGKSGLSKLLKPAVDYHETSIGVEIFSIVSKHRIAESCPIFRSLLDTAIEIECNFAMDPNLL